MNDIITVFTDGEPFTTTDALAIGTDSNHSSVIRLVRDNIVMLEIFGRVGFEVAPFDTAGGPQIKTVAVLNERQATLLMTFMRNTKIIKSFKVRLVQAFYELSQNQLNRQISTTEQRNLLIQSLNAQNVAEAQLEKGRKIYKPLIAQMEQDSPKVVHFDNYTDKGDLMGLRETAKALKARQNKFISWLIKSGVIYNQGTGNQVYTTVLTKGYMEHKPVDIGDGREKYQPMFTASGFLWIAKRWDKYNTDNTSAKTATQKKRAHICDAAKKWTDNNEGMASCQ
jgi:phage antirepressor YoqD-like protein